MALIRINIGAHARSGLPHRPAGSLRRGYTLIEMLLVLVVLAILTVIVVPTYRDFVLRANRAVGRGAILDVMARQEQYYVSHKSYANTLEALGLPATYYVDRLAAVTVAGEAVYQIQLIVQSSVYQGVRAIPRNRQSRDSPCMTLAIGKRGLKTVSGTDAGRPFSCW